MTQRPFPFSRLVAVCALAALLANSARAAQTGSAHPEERPTATPQIESEGHAEPGAQPPASSQPARERARDRFSSAQGQSRGGPELREDTFRLIDAYVISNIQESLGLSDEQFGRVLPLVKKLQADRRDFARRRMQALRSLRKTLTSGAATEAGVADLLKEVKSAAADEHAGSQKNLEALDAILTPLQQAKYRVFEAEVELRLRHLLARSQDRATPGGK